MTCLLMVTWFAGVVFAAVVLLVVLISYAVLFWAFRNQPGPEGEE